MGRDIAVLDLEITRSPDDCTTCDQPRETHSPKGQCCPGAETLPTVYQPLGWHKKAALGISVGCLWSYRRRRVLFFDERSLADCVAWLVKDQPWLVSYNGVSFDFAVMRGILRERAQLLPAEQTDVARTLVDLCDQFKVQASTSYDLLQALWQADPGSRQQRGVNGLDSMSQANGLSKTAIHGAQMPALWRDGQVAKVINHCVDDVLRTKRLFDRIMATGQLKRPSGAWLALERPAPLHADWQQYPQEDTA